MQSFSVGKIDQRKSLVFFFKFKNKIHFPLVLQLVLLWFFFLIFLLLIFFHVGKFILSLIFPFPTITHTHTHNFPFILCFFFWLFIDFSLAFLSIFLSFFGGKFAFLFLLFRKIKFPQDGFPQNNRKPSKVNDFLKKTLTLWALSRQRWHFSFKNFLYNFNFPPKEKIPKS